MTPNFHKLLFSFILTFLLASLIFSIPAVAEPRLIVPKGSSNWSAPIYAEGDSILLFTTSSQNEIWRFQPGVDKAPELIAKGEGIGRRFVTDPGKTRVVYKQTAEAHPNKAERLLSCSFYLRDPSMLTSNNGKLSGPYRFADKIYYRDSLMDSLRDCSGKAYYFGPFYDKATKQLTIYNSEGQFVFSTTYNSPVTTYEQSPNSYYVAVMSDQPDYFIYIVGCEDGTRMDIGNGWWPAWSGDSNRLTWISTRTDQSPTAIGIFDLRARRYGSIKDLDNLSPVTPALNYNGTKVLFVHDGSIYEVDVPIQ